MLGRFGGWVDTCVVGCPGVPLGSVHPYVEGLPVTDCAATHLRSRPGALSHRAYWRTRLGGGRRAS